MDKGTILVATFFILLAVAKILQYQKRSEKAKNAVIRAKIDLSNSKLIKDFLETIGRNKNQITEILIWRNQLNASSGGKNFFNYSIPRDAREFTKDEMKIIRDLASRRLEPEYFLEDQYSGEIDSGTYYVKPKERSKTPY